MGVLSPDSKFYRGLSTATDLVIVNLLTLAAWADVPELEMTLAHPDGRQRNVCFARPALSDCAPVAYRAPEDGTAQYEAPTIHLMTI